MESTTATPTTTSTGSESATSSAPVSTGSPTPASSSPTPAERPKTMAEAFARDATAQTTPSAETGTATTQPAEGQTTVSATSPSTEQGPIPFTVHKTALDNARTKAVDDFRSTSGVDKAIELSQRISTNPAGFLAEYARELLASPQHAAATKAELARMFGGLRQAAQARTAAAEPMPGPDVQIVDANGNVTGTTYSADQLAKRDTWREKQLLAKVQQELGPLKTERDQRQATEQAAEASKQANARADEHMARVDRILDGNKALYADVQRLMVANPTLDAVDAALEVRQTKIAPAAAGKAQADVLESLKTKAAAQAVNPASAVVAATSRPRSFMDKSLKW